MILHIPHSSTNTLEYKIQHRDRELLRMTDHYTDELYSYDKASRIVLGVSRLICDVERFEDDALESMSRFGMGVCYTKNTQGDLLRNVSDADRKNILESFSYPHHQNLSDGVEKELERQGSALVIDCHSFPDEAYYFNSDFGEKRPDICLGTDDFHTPKKLLEDVKKFFLSKGYTVKVNTPFSGTMVPLKYYKKEKSVHSIMIELNRKLYMDKDAHKTEHFYTLQEELSALLTQIHKEYSTKIQPLNNNIS